MQNGIYLQWATQILGMSNADNCINQRRYLQWSTQIAELANEDGCINRSALAERKQQASWLNDADV